MTTLVANELRKLRTIRSPWLLLAAGPVLVIVGVADEVVGGADLTQPQTASHAVAHAGVVSLLTLIFGITAVAGEYRHQTITDTYLATPRRGRLIAAKFAVYTLVGAVFGLVLAITALVATAVAITANDGSLDLSNRDLWRTLAGGIACNAAFAAIGVSLGALIPNLAAAIATALAWIALVEGLIGELVGDLEAWLPFAGGQALGRLPGAPDISQWTGGLLLAGYVVVFAATALTTSVRRDIT
jgi:ABC-2 type transport system permease protein